MITDYLTWFRDKRGASPTSLDKYRLVLTAWVTWCKGTGTDLADAEAEDIEQFCARPRRYGTPAKPATIAVEVAILGSFYRWAQARHGWAHNPALLAGRPKVKNRQPRPVDDDVWLQVWTSELPTPARVALGLGYFCGLRRSEIVRLHGNQIWGGALVNFVRKGGGEDRFDYADVLAHWGAFMPHMEPERLAQPLAQLARQRGEDRLMPWHSVRPQALNKRLGSWLEGCGLEPDAFTPHQLRHSFATNLLASGVPLDVACDLCNHSSPTITMRYVRTSGGRLASLRKDMYGPATGPRTLAH